ncbi:hypothetical protein LUZ63_000052 [Rhynchospora breviuscula]|uniref:AP2/ERF domain-containing protein n=1 Tax=Rhynchospora breviuscula TaxID=2022672 RepID=A0A9Q0HWH6_9POAL|nr:hypothetical protein LUZ63_000052 [Rhynchospora breviuscula]
MERGREACCSPMVKEEPTTTITTTVAPNPSSSSSASASASSASPPSSSSSRQYRGVRMRKWGKWVAEIREPNKRSRIWLGSYSSPVAAARAYDTAVFYLRGRSARLNFPEEIIEADLMPEPGTSASAEGLPAALIRKKATEVGARVDAMHAAATRETLTHHQSELPQHKRQLQQLEEREHNPIRVRNHRNPDLNQAPSPDSSDME